MTDIDESRRESENPAAYACRLSAEKAEAAAGLISGEALILAADTIVVDGDVVLGKPVDGEDARRILASLRGRVHEVYTAITLLDTGRRVVETDLARSRVQMRAYTDEEIAAYIASGDPFDKAGAYAIQNEDFRPAIGFDHCFANVMGLPLCHVARLLDRMGFREKGDMAEVCQAGIGYQCQVFEGILNGRDSG